MHAEISILNITTLKGKGLTLSHERHKMRIDYLTKLSGVSLCIKIRKIVM